MAALSALTLGLARLGQADVTAAGFNVACSPCTGPPGSTISLTVDWCMTGNEAAHLLVAFRPTASGNQVSSCPAAGQEFVIYSTSNGSASSPSPPDVGGSRGFALPQISGCST